jgi:SAM-dependent methyltransferase
MYLYKMDLDERIEERERIRAINQNRQEQFILDTIHERFSIPPDINHKVLDFGCGKGKTVKYLQSIGYDSYGCDITNGWVNHPDTLNNKLSQIQINPYELPYEDYFFDVVYSCSVLEHAKNTEEYFSEIYRVLKKGGVSFHIFPAKWYLPYEPHIKIPLVNYFWPHCPGWWINFWLIIRGIFIPKVASYRKDVLQAYINLCNTGIIYIPTRRYKKISIDIFGNYGSLMDFYINHANGGLANLARKLHLYHFGAWVSSNFRMYCFYQKKS